MSRKSPGVSRLSIVFFAVALVTAAAAPPALGASTDAAVDGKLTRPVSEMATFNGFDAGDRVKSHGPEANPGFFIGYSNGSSDDLSEWVNGSDDRRMHWQDNETKVALISAPPKHVGVTGLDRLLNNGLLSLSYVKYVGVNMRVEVDPVKLDSHSEWQKPSGAWKRFGQGSLSSDGLAFNGDVNATTPDEWQSAIARDGVSKTGEGTTGAVLDSGCNIRDGTVYGNGTAGSSLRVTAAKNFLTNETVNTTASDPNYSIVADGHNHGSHVSSTLLANTSNDTYDGVAPDANLACGKVLGDDGKGSTLSIIQGVKWASSEEVDADIIAMSLGSPTYSKALEDALNTAYANGSLPVVAAGNSRYQGVGLASPADADKALSVGASTAEPPENASSAYFSQVGYDDGVKDMSNGVTRGANVDVSAPGMKITARILTEDGLTRDVTMSGTSMAQPVVAGVALLTRDADPSLDESPGELRKRVTATASPAPNMAVSETGDGMVNASNAVNDVEPDTSQEDAMTTEAEARQNAHAAMGGSIARLITRPDTDRL